MTGRSRKEITENVYNYPYYEVIRRLLATLMDSEPHAEVIKMMHSQLQTMFRQLFNSKLIHGLIENLSIRRGSYLLDSKPLKGRRKREKLDLVHFRHYLSEVFDRECRSFQRFMEQTKRATVNADLEDNLSEVHSASSLESGDNSSEEVSNEDHPPTEDADAIEH